MREPWAQQKAPTVGQMAVHSSSFTSHFPENVLLNKTLLLKDDIKQCTYTTWPYPVFTESHNIGIGWRIVISLGGRCFRGHVSRLFWELPIHFKGPCSALHIFCIPSNSLPPHPHVLFCPLRIPFLSPGANLLVEAFWLHLPFKSYRLKLNSFPLCSIPR